MRWIGLHPRVPEPAGRLVDRYGARRVMSGLLNLSRNLGLSLHGASGMSPA
jgi:hypothetical protein